jgi:hypothetical protein
LLVEINLDRAHHQAHAQAGDEQHPHAPADEFARAAAGLGGEGPFARDEVAVGLAEEDDRRKIGQRAQCPLHDTVAGCIGHK